mgnify:FL=1|tara:strand:- start:2457 stop:2696 length:240 start_codon:yes stop_codon:yes gene_type:complete
MSHTTQIEKNLAYCIEYLELDDLMIGEMFKTIEEFGIASVEYFCEEFVFKCTDSQGNDDLDALGRIHDENYLKIKWRLT